jgi:hypothetical protein
MSRKAFQMFICLLTLLAVFAKPASVRAQTVLAFYHDTLSSNLSFSGYNRVNNVFTQSVTMPSSGCPCRVRVDYMLVDEPNTSVGDFWASDGTDSFASVQIHGSGVLLADHAGAGAFSTGTYGNSQGVTFTLNQENTNPGGTQKWVILASPQFPASDTENSFFDVSVVSSN